MNNQGNVIFCSQCGTQNDVSSAFCKNCGNRLHSEPVQSAPSATYTAAQTEAPKPKIPPVTNAIRTMVLSPFALITAIAFTLMIFFYISDADIFMSTVMGELRSALSQAGLYTSEMELVTKAVSDLTSFVAVIAMLPSIVIAIGMWCIVYAATEKNKRTLSTAGLTTIRTVALIEFIFAIIGVVGYVVVCGDALLKISKYGAQDMISPIVIFVLILVLAALIFRAYVFHKTKELMDALKYNFRYPGSPVAPSIFMAVMSFISFGVYLISALSEGAKSDWCAAVAFFGFGFLIIKFGSKMNELQLEARNFREEDVQTDYGAVYKAPSTKTPANTAIVVTIVLVVIAAIVGFSFFYTPPNIDKDLIGEWEHETDLEAGAIFKRNGTCILNVDSDEEEKGTYTAKDGTLTLIIDGDEYTMNYRIIDEDKLQITKTTIYSYEQEIFYRVD